MNPNRQRAADAITIANGDGNHIKEAIVDQDGIDDRLPRKRPAHCIQGVRRKLTGTELASPAHPRKWDPLAGCKLNKINPQGDQQLVQPELEGLGFSQLHHGLKSAFVWNIPVAEEEILFPNFLRIAKDCIGSCQSVGCLALDLAGDPIIDDPEGHNDQ